LRCRAIPRRRLQLMALRIHFDSPLELHAAVGCASGPRLQSGSAASGAPRCAPPFPHNGRPRQWDRAIRPSGDVRNSSTSTSSDAVAVDSAATATSVAKCRDFIDPPPLMHGRCCGANGHVGPGNVQSVSLVQDAGFKATPVSVRAARTIRQGFRAIERRIQSIALLHNVALQLPYISPDRRNLHVDREPRCRLLPGAQLRSAARGRYPWRAVQWWRQASCFGWHCVRWWTTLARSSVHPRGRRTDPIHRKSGCRSICHSHRLRGARTPQPVPRLPAAASRGRH